ARAARRGGPRLMVRAWTTVPRPTRARRGACSPRRRLPGDGDRLRLSSEPMQPQRVPVRCPDHIPDGFRRMVAQVADDIAAALPALHPELRVEVGDPGERTLMTFTVWFDHVRR